MYLLFASTLRQAFFPGKYKGVTQMIRTSPLAPLLKKERGTTYLLCAGTLRQVFVPGEC
jgi:hypothetical protein